MTDMEKVKASALIRVVDDDQAHCAAMVFMLECKGWRVAAYTSAKAFLTEDPPSEPGCLILDVHMPEVTGLELQQELKKRGSRIPIIFLTGYGDVDMAVYTLHEGAVDFLQKPVNMERLVAAVEKTASASVVLAEPFRFMTADEARERLTAVTAREHEILRLSGQQLSSRQIGERLGISERTVESHRGSAMKKLGLHSTADLIQLMGIAEGAE